MLATAFLAALKGKVETPDPRYNGRRLALVLIALLVGCGTDTTPADPAVDDSAAAETADASAVDTATTDSEKPEDSGFGADGDLADVADVADTGLPDIDLSLCPGGPGCPCKEEGECDTLKCLETPTGKQCAKKCVDDCPSGFACITGTGDAAAFCYPKWGLLCRPCRKSAECQQAGVPHTYCVDYGEDVGGFCGSFCEADSECPADYKCELAPSTDGGKHLQCVRRAADGEKSDAYGVCTCSPAAAKGYLSTTCWVPFTDKDNSVIGRCRGERFCTPDTGLTACSKLQGDAEDCKDVQCEKKGNGTPCDDGNPCTKSDACGNEKCNPGPNVCPCIPGVKECPYDGNACIGKRVCAATDTGDVPYSCVVNQSLVVECPAHNDTDCAKNACDPKTGACAMVPAGKNIACDDGNGCTSGDTCDEAGVCQSGAVICKCQKDADCPDDGDLCNGTRYCDRSDEDHGKWQCRVNPATVVECPVLDEQCRSIVCLPKTATCATVELTDAELCSDDNACTSGDACDGKGGCKPGTTQICPCGADADCLSKDDGDVCNGVMYCEKATKKCKHNPATVVVCPTVHDTFCRANKCEPSSGVCGFVSTGANACDDDNPCTKGDTCEGIGCTAGANTCDCTQDADCTSREDGNVCNGTLYCNKAAGKCELNPKTIVTCQTVLNTVCQVNACQPLTGDCKVVPRNNGIGCDADGNPCTVGDGCGGGKCVPGPNTCSCNVDSDCAIQEDGNQCNGTLFCDKSGSKAICRVNPASVVNCDKTKDTDCAAARCSPLIGKCALIAGADNTPCSDGLTCTTGEVCLTGKCVGGVNVCGCLKDDDCAKFDDADKCNGVPVCGGGKCVPGKPLACDDSNLCTDDSCDKAKGCVNLANAVTCTDGDPCTTTDVCADKKCTTSGKLTCDDGNGCTDDACVAKKGCVFTPDASNCDDGNACTTGDQCIGKDCAKGQAITCDDNNPCTDDSCHAGSAQTIGKGCVFTHNKKACDDGSKCTVSDVCDDGKCVSGQAKDCDDANGCSNDACDAKLGCVVTPNSNPCDDENACTTADTCKDKACVGGPPPKCDDKNPCTVDSCDKAKGCQTADNKAPCDDGNPCTKDDVCGAGACKSGQNICGCQSNGDCAPKEDGDLCNGTLFCDKSKVPFNCKINTATIVTCSTDKNTECLTAVCDPKSGACPMKPAPNAKPCDADSSVCTVGDSCESGSCTKGAAQQCDDKNPCTDDSCNPVKGCVAVANTDSCSDSNACTTQDVCSSGVCRPGDTKNCDDGNGCTTDSCDPSKGCVQTNNTAKCDDGQKCTANDACAGGACKSGAPVSCDDHLECTTDSCDPNTGSCQHAGDDKVCDDENVCTDDRCDPGQGCLHAANQATCDDGDLCTSGDKCGVINAKATCVAGAAIKCNDDNECTADKCDKGKCVFTATSENDSCALAGGCGGGGVCLQGVCNAQPTTGIVRSSPDGGGGLAHVAPMAGGGFITVARPGTSNHSVITRYGAGFERMWMLAQDMPDLAGPGGGIVGAHDTVDARVIVIGAGKKDAAAGVWTPQLWNIDATGKKTDHRTLACGTDVLSTGREGDNAFVFLTTQGGGKLCKTNTLGNTLGKIDVRKSTKDTVTGGRVRVVSSDAALVAATINVSGLSVTDMQLTRVALKTNSTVYAVTLQTVNMAFKAIDAAADGTLDIYAAVREDENGTQSTWLVQAAQSNGAIKSSHQVKLASGTFLIAALVNAKAGLLAMAGSVQDTSGGRQASIMRTGLDGKLAWARLYAAANGSALVAAMKLDKDRVIAVGSAPIASGKRDLTVIQHGLDESCIGAIGCSVSSQCPDDGGCRAGGCSSKKVCFHAGYINGRRCDDGLACKAGTCASQQCSNGAAVSCNDFEGCTLDACNAGLGCEHTPLKDQTPCSDGDACTTNEACMAGACSGGDVQNCGTGKGCTAGACHNLTCGGKKGLTWWATGWSGDGYQRVWCDGTQVGKTKCDPHAGDTACTSMLPVWCYKYLSAANPGGVWDFKDSELRITKPVLGCGITSQAIGNKLCSDRFGAGYVWLGHHHNGWGISGYGQRDIPYGSHAWALIKDQANGNCY